MYLEFDVYQIKKDAMNKQIIIFANMDVDVDTVNHNTIKLIKEGDESTSFSHFVVNGSEITAYLIDYPVPEQTYRITIDGIANIAGDTNKTIVDNDITFDDYLIHCVSFISPEEHEEVCSEEASIELCSEPWIDEEQYFVLEYSSNNAFIDAERLTSTIPVFSVLREDYGQLYLRARVEQSEEVFGTWSEVNTFHFIEKDDSEDGEDGENPEIPPIQVPFTFTVPECGVTPLEFVFTFSENLEELLEDQELDCTVDRRVV